MLHSEAHHVKALMQAAVRLSCTTKLAVGVCEQLMNS